MTPNVELLCQVCFRGCPHAEYKGRGKWACRLTGKPASEGVPKRCPPLIAGMSFEDIQVYLRAGYGINQVKGNRTVCMFARDILNGGKYIAFDRDDHCYLDVPKEEIQDKDAKWIVVL